MESLTYLLNGQWILKKMSWGQPDYDVHIRHGDSPFGKNLTAANNAKNKFISGLENTAHAKYKDMKNSTTGKYEKHVLVHRGISSGDDSLELKSQNGPNMLSWSKDGHVTTTHNSIHTLNSEEAEGHATDTGRVGKTLSFWVPISSIHGYSHDINRFSNTSNEYADDFDHIMISPGKYKIHEAKDYDNSGLYND